MKIISDHIDGCKFYIGNLDSLGVLSFVQFSLDREPRFRFGVGNQVEHHFMANQGFATPVHGDKGKQAVFNLVPFAGSWRVMADSNRNADFIGQSLQLQLPQPDTSTITSTTVCRNKQFFGIGVRFVSNNLPPASNCLYRECRSVMICADTHPTFVGSDIVNSIWVSTTSFFNKIIDFYFGWISFRAPRLTIVLKATNQFFLLGVNRNDRFPFSQSICNLFIYVDKLSIPVRVPSSFKGFLVSLQAISKLYQQLPYMGMADFMSHFTKFIGQSAQTLARPAERRFRIATSDRVNQKLKVSLQGRVDFGGALSTCAGTPYAGTCRLFFKLTRFKFLQTSVYCPTRNSGGFSYRGNSSVPKNLGFSGRNQTSKALVKRPLNKIIPLGNLRSVHALTVAHDAKM